MSLDGHDCFCPEFAVLPGSQAPPNNGVWVEFGFKEDTNRVAGCARKDKGADNYK
jgi:hypothetical protein